VGHFFSFDSAIKDQIPAGSRARVHVLPFGVDPKGLTRFRSPMRIVRGMDVTYALIG